MKLQNKNLVNVDCNCYVYSPDAWQPEGGAFGKAGIHNFVSCLAGHGVDTLVVNPSAQLLWMPSRRGLEYVHEGYTRGDKSHFAANARCENIRAEDLDAYYERCVNLHDKYVDMLEQGVNWFEETGKACRANGISPWISIRMNDTHGGANPDAGFFGNCKLFNEDPTVRMRKPCMYPWDRIERFAMDYSQQRVRDHMFAIIAECIEEYDYEGCELDFLRDPIILNPVASAADIEMISGWIAEIKQLCDKKSRSTGRPFPLGIRTPGHLNLMRDMGLDIRQLAQRRVIDFIGVSNYWQTSWDMPHDELRAELGDTLTIYGVIEGGPNWLKARAGDSSHTQALEKHADFYANAGDRPMQYSKELVYGNAAGKLVLGADGIEQFNNFYSWDQRIPMPPAFDALRHLDSLDFLRGKEKQYTLSGQGRNPSTNIPYETVELLPDTLEPARRRSYRIPMCREPLDQGLEFVVQIVCEQRNAPLKIGVSLNGGWPSFTGTQETALLFPCGIYTHLQTGQEGYNFVFPVSLLREGWNQIQVFNGEEMHSDNTYRILSVEAAVKKTP